MDDSRCFVCGGKKHADNTDHQYWSQGAAMREAREHDRQVVLRETPEARFVRQYRPY